MQTNLFHLLYKQTNQPNLTLFVQFCTILDIGITLMIGLSALFSPSMKTTVLNKETTFTVIFIIIISLSILSFKRLSKINSVFMFRAIIISIFTVILIYLAYTYLIWYFNTIEGAFNFRFIKFYKAASLEAKLDFYNLISSQIIEQYKSSDVMLGRYLEKCPSVINPSNITLLQTPYEQISTLVHSNLCAEVEHYKSIITIPPSKKPSQKAFYIKLFASVLLVGGTLFLINQNFDFVKKALKKSFELLEQTQTKLIDFGKKSATDSVHHAAAEVDIQFLARNAIALSKKINTLSNKTDALYSQTVSLHNQVERLTYMVNHVIRPCMSSMYYSLTKSKQQILQEFLTAEQKDFIEATSKLIFK